MFCKKSTIKNLLTEISSISYRRCSDNMFIDNQQILSNEVINVWYISDTLITASEGQQITNTIDFPPTSNSLTKYYVFSNTTTLSLDEFTACSNLANAGNSLILIGYTTSPLSALQAGDVVYNVATNQPIIISKIYNELDRVDGVQSVTSVKVNNLYDTVSGYSGNVYDIEAATKSGVIYPSLDASIFEVKFPNNDIIGKVISL